MGGGLRLCRRAGSQLGRPAGFVSGLKLGQLCADLASFVEGRRHDNGHVRMRFVETRRPLGGF